MATYKFDKIEYNGNTYVVSDSEALPLTGGQVTGPVTFGDTVSIDEATVGDLVVNGSASFTNNIQANTISGDLTGDVTGNVVGNVSGSAGTAGAFTSAKSVTLTGDVTGSASSTGGWSVATTVKDDSHNHTADTIMVPKITKSYTGVIASANNHDNAALYCIKIVPNSYAGQWYLKYRVFANMDGISDANGHGYEESYVYINGMRNTYASYRTWNNVSNTSYRPYYYHSIYRAKEAGATTYGHVMGINLYNSYSPTNTTYKRNVTFEILDYSGCTISFFDAPTKYASIPGTGSTNYDGRTDFDGAMQGNTMSGDRNTTTTYGTIDYYFRPYAGQALYRYKYVMQGEDNRIYPITVTNQADATQVAKVPTTVGLRPWKIWWYTTTTTINAGALIGGQVLQETGYTTSAVYNFNTDIPTYQMIYLKGTYNATKDLFYLYNDGSSPCTSYYTLVPNNTANIILSNYFAEGYYYILLGASYSSTNYITLFGNHPLYYFDGTNLKEVNRIAPNWDENDSTSPSYIENRTHYRTSIGYSYPITCKIYEWHAGPESITVGNVTKTYPLDAISLDSFPSKHTFSQINTTVTTTTATVTINNNTISQNLNIECEDGYALFYNDKIAIAFEEYQDSNGNYEQGIDCAFINGDGTTFNVDLSTEVQIVVNIPVVLEQFSYTTLDNNYLNGKLITEGTGENSEIFNDVNNIAFGSYSHAEGYNVIVTGDRAHGEGEGSVAGGYASHAEGSSEADGNYSHAEGSRTTASGRYSHSEGRQTTASGESSHAEGGSTTASGIYSHAEGYVTTAQRRSQHVFGEYNILDTGGSSTSTKGTYIEIVGKGTSSSARSNARTLDWSGNEVLAGKLTVGAAPTNNMDVATKQYVDSAVGSGITYLQGSVSVNGTTATLSGVSFKAVLNAIRNGNVYVTFRYQLSSNGTNITFFPTSYVNDDGCIIYFIAHYNNKIYQIKTNLYSASSTSTSFTGTLTTVQIF